MLLEALATGVGSQIAKSTLKLWLKDDEFSAEVGGSVAEILIKKIPDLLSRKRTERTFDEIQDLSADSVLKMLKKEAEDIEDSRLEMIADAAKNTLSNVPINARFIISKNMDTDELLQHFLSLTGSEGGNPGLAGILSNNNEFSDKEKNIYKRILSHSAQLIVDISASLPRFEEHVSKELLQRTASMAEQVIEGMNKVVAEQGDAFEADYRNACVRKWDHLELFGVDLQKRDRRYNLTVAYVTLMVERSLKEAEGENLTNEDSDNRNAQPVDEALANNQRLFVRGPAGSGKTTMLQWFAVFAAGRNLTGELAQYNDCVPFLIKLRHYADEKLPEPTDFPKEASKGLACQMPEGWVIEKLKSGKAIIMVDGLDETIEDKREEVREWLQDLIAVYPKARYLVTSRPHAAKEGWLDTDNFVDAELQDMARADIFEFIEHWHEAVAQEVEEEDEKQQILALAPAMQEKLNKTTSIYRLATSPLLCALLCALHRKRVTNLPSDRIELYRLCIEMFFQRDEQRGITDKDYITLTTRQKESLLQDFAWWMIRNGRTTASPEEAKNRFKRQLKGMHSLPTLARLNAAGTLKLFLQRIGIIRQLAHQKIDFPHRTFQEFLAAKAAVDEDDIGLLVENAHDDQWREVVILSAGLLSPRKASQLVLEILERGDKDSKNQHTLYLIAVAAFDVVVTTSEELNIKKEVAKRLENIVPPKNLTEAKELASAGELVVPHLKYKKMTVKQAAASVRTLALICNDQALTYIREYSYDSRIGVQEEIVNSIKFSPDSSRFASSAIYNKKYLNLNNLDIQDLSFIKNSPKLRRLLLKRTGIKDISPLKYCKNLQELIIGHNPITLIDTLQHCVSLRQLHMQFTDVKDLDPLSKCPNLEDLNIRATLVDDLSALSKCTDLMHLDLEYSQVTELTAIQNCSELKTLYTDGTNITNFLPIKNLVNIENMSLPEHAVKNPKDLLTILKNLTELNDLDIDFFNYYGDEIDDFIAGLEN